jgi:hypothetical protein
MNMKNKSTLFLVQAALIAAVYVVLTLVFAPFSYGEIQVRISEALTILPFFTPAAIPGLFVGCILANLLGGAIPLDIAFGSIATLIGAVFTYKLRNSNKWLAPVPPIVASSGSIRTSLRLFRQSSDSTYDAYGRCRRDHFLRNLWNGTSHCTFQVQEYTVWQTGCC